MSWKKSGRRSWSCAWWFRCVGVGAVPSFFLFFFLTSCFLLLILSFLFFFFCSPSTPLFSLPRFGSPTYPFLLFGSLPFFLLLSPFCPFSLKRRQGLMGPLKKSSKSSSTPLFSLSHVLALPPFFSFFFFSPPPILSYPFSLKHGRNHDCVGTICPPIFFFYFISFF